MKWKDKIRNNSLLIMVIVIIVFLSLVMFAWISFTSKSIALDENSKTNLNQLQQELDKEAELEKKKKEKLEAKKKAEEKKKAQELKKKKKNQKEQTANNYTQTNPGTNNNQKSNQTQQPKKQNPPKQIPSNDESMTCSSAYAKQKELLGQSKASSVVELGGGRCNLIIY